eukprot:TRINITY_DN18896_c0_g1_i1.p1 TRINITY_DN18896_c0_g1~~TRINITY_DN18896_c0_g1_i1.p1  ORF type:complete len:133 (-),score=11.18 TRINITY_DN18896_c0_g1_i1:176-574(-)
MEEIAINSVPSLLSFTEDQSLKEILRVNSVHTEAITNITSLLQQNKFEEALKESELLRQISWDNLHFGDWKSIDPIWRDIYSFSCFSSSICLAFSKNRTESLKWLDYGIVIGGSKFLNPMRKMASILTQKIS